MLEEAKKRKGTLERQLEELEKDGGKESLQESTEKQESSTMREGSSSELQDETGKELRGGKQDKLRQEIRSKLQEAVGLGSNVENEVEKLREELADLKSDSEAKMSELSGRVKETKVGELKSDSMDEQVGKDGTRGIRGDDKVSIEDNKAYKESNEGLSEKLSRVQDCQKAFAAKLDEIEMLKEELKRE